MRSARSLPLLSFLLAASVPALAQAPKGELDELLDLLNTPVVSASKSEQKLSNAPAKVVVVTSEEIRSRGYTDFEQIFHDLAGMDISQGRGVEYSTIFMRGMRTENTDRFLLIWDGVIQNDIWKYNVWISRQYPLTNIDRIEIMYGPSSLLYGANAFAGIVNVILKKQKGGLELAAQTGVGSYATRWVEASAGYNNGAWRFNALVRSFRSDEYDLNGKSWTDNAGRKRYYNLEYPRDYVPAGSPGSSIVLDPATGLPLRSYDGVLKPYDGRYRMDTNDWYVQVGAGYKNFDIKGTFWYRKEIEDTWYVPANRQVGPWTPTGGAVYATYEQPISEQWSAKYYAMMRTSGLDEEESSDRSHSSTTDNDPANPVPIKVTNLRALDFYDLFNREFRGGAQFNFAKTGMNVVTGLEHTRTTNYEDYNFRRLSSLPWTRSKQHTEGNMAAYANAQVETSEQFSLAAGFRYDYNWMFGEAGGFKHLYSGRFAAIWSPNQIHRFKLIYGQAFQAPSAWHKFSVVAGARDNPNPNLKPERLTSGELIYELMPTQRWKNTFSLYYTQITDLIKINTLASQHQNIAGVNIFGTELESTYYFSKDHSLYANLSTNSAKTVDTGQDPGDIAPVKANIGWNYLLKGRFGFNVRGHYVAARDTVTQYWVAPASYFTVKKVDSYVTLDATFTYRDIFKGLDLNLSLMNLLNAEYYDPGLRDADGKKYAGAILQPGFRGNLGVTYRF